MPSGRAVLLLRRLSTSDTRFKNINVNQNSSKETHNLQVNYKTRDLSNWKRYSIYQTSNLLSPGLKSPPDNPIIKMSTSHSDTASSSKETHKFTNRLINEKSPYLLQHAHNPVDWYPWGPEAFEKAKKENKLIFLSVGYSTCHWCHVMEKESFENEAIAKIMNDHFVNVKVDREERPDIDKVYMLFVQATSRGGGWPMSVFLTPDLNPVTGGTYFPPEDKWGRSGFKSILLSLAKKWSQNKQDFMETGRNIISVLQKASVLDKPDAITVPGEDAWNKCIQQYIRNYEPEFGGFGHAPKFPQASNFNFLFHVYARNKTDPKSKTCLDMCLHTLKRMANGGIHDHISSGFARYSVDHKWHVPHFEKMLYDQAQLAVAYTDAFLATKDQFYADVARDILKYVDRDLSHESGGFYSAEDADSYPTYEAKQKREGAFCVWEHEEVEYLLEDLHINSIKFSDIFCHHFDVKPNGNIERNSDPHGELINKNVLIVLGSKEHTAEKFGLTIEQLNQVLKDCTALLYEARQKRPRPHLDSKILCSWNGLMISGFAKAGQGLGEKSYIERAVKAANFLKNNLYDETERVLLRSIYRDEDGKIAQTAQTIPGFLDDYAFLIKGLLDLYEASLDLAWLHWARELQQRQDQLFWDAEDGGYFTSTVNDPTVVLRLKEDQDGAEPCGNSVACHNLLRLSAYSAKSEEQGDGHERAMAERILSAFSGRLIEMPMALPEMISALMFYTDSPTQVFISGSCSDPRTLDLLRVVRSRLLPARVLAVSDPAAPDATSVVFSRIRAKTDVPTAYVCRRYACSLPVTDAAQLEKLLDD